MSEDTSTKEPKREFFRELYNIVKRLRAPDGCPWDKKQTVRSLKPFLLEEVYECFEAIDDNDTAHLKEELGDVFMLATMIGYIMEQEGSFSVDEVLAEVNAKLVRRHPHVFGDVDLKTSEEVIRQWDDIKENVEGRKETKSVLDKVPRHLPPLERAYQMQRRCSQVGFDWDAVEDVWAKVKEEMAEVNEADGNADRLEEEMGDLLFSLVNLSRFLKIDPSVALHRSNTKFSRRFGYVEVQMHDSGQTLSADNMKSMDTFWNEAKEQDRIAE